MKLASESGHALNICAFENFLKALKDHQGEYVPLLPAQRIEELERLLDWAIRSNEKANKVSAESKLHINYRYSLFRQMPPLLTKIIKTLKMLGVSADQVSIAESYARKLTGKRVPKKSGTTHQMTYASRLEHFSALVEFLKGVPEYGGLKSCVAIGKLNDYVEELRLVNNRANDCSEILSRVRLIRNSILYWDLYGVVDLVRNIRTQISFDQGVHSPLYLALKPYSFSKSKKYQLLDSFPSITDLFVIGLE